MEESFFDLAVQSANRRRLNELNYYEQPAETFQLTPIQAAQIERQLNAKKEQDIIGYMLMPIRREDQTLYKQGMRQQSPKTFVQEEELILLQFYRDLDSVTNKVSQQQFHCFLTLEQLRRHHLSIYFMTLPDPLYLKLYDFNDIIGQPLDIRLIANKLLRRKYKNKDDFQVDMVAMIQNYRIYFINDKEMFDISIKFQMLFWDIYTTEEKTNKEAMQTFKYYKQRCKKARRIRVDGSKILSQKKKQLIEQFNELAPEIKRKIIFCLEVSLKLPKLGTTGQIKLNKMNDKFYNQLQNLLNKEQEDPSKRPKQTKKKTIKRKKQSKQDSKGMKEEVNNANDDIYYSDEQESVENKKQKDVSRQAIQEVMDLINMEEDIFGSDDYD